MKKITKPPSEAEIKAAVDAIGKKDKKKGKTASVVVADKDQPIEAKPGEGGAKKPTDSGGPNEAYPFGIQFTTASGVSYERFKTAKLRDKRLTVVGKSEKVSALDYRAIRDAKAPDAPKGPALVPPAKGGDNVQAINKRLTPGAVATEWRVARSLRVGKPGFFLQGGYIEIRNGKKFFRCAEEEYFKSLHDAKTALVAKLPPQVAVGDSVQVS